MVNASGRTIDTEQWNGACLFVHFDFDFFPMRVYSGHGSISWEGHEWHGIGDVLRRDASSNWSILSSYTNERGKNVCVAPDEQGNARDPGRRILPRPADAVDDLRNGREWGVERRICINRGRISAAMVRRVSMAVRNRRLNTTVQLAEAIAAISCGRVKTIWK